VSTQPALFLLAKSSQPPGKASEIPPTARMAWQEEASEIPPTARMAWQAEARAQTRNTSTPGLRF
jgi:hypothetical protein